jgi:hypothetical protein
MSALTRAVKPEIALRSPNNPKPIRDLRQAGPFTKAICICGHRFDISGVPSPRTLTRMIHACSLIDSSKENELVIASGGLIGTSGSSRTEAQLIDCTLRSWGYRGVFREEFALDSVGNVSMSFLGFIRPLHVPAVAFVTDPPHAARVEVLSKHILRGLADASVEVAPWPLSAADEQEERKREQNGWSFVEQFLDEVPPGMPEYALEWVAANHRSHPYIGWDVEELVAALHGQILDFNVDALAFSLTESADEFEFSHI